MSFEKLYLDYQLIKKCLEWGSNPRLHRRIELKSTALDHSAIEAWSTYLRFKSNASKKYCILDFDEFYDTNKKSIWVLRALVAQMVERKTLNLVVVGSSPTEGAYFFSLWK